MLTTQRLRDLMLEAGAPRGVKVARAVGVLAMDRGFLKRLLSALRHDADSSRIETATLAQEIAASGCSASTAMRAAERVREVFLVVERPPPKRMTAAEREARAARERLLLEGDEG